MKWMSLSLAFAAVTAAAAAGAAPAQDVQGLPLALRDSSILSIDGTSTLHGFTCRTHDIQAQVTVDSGYTAAPLNTLAHPLDHASVTIPVKSLKCGDGHMDDNMYGTLKAKEYPDIKYVLTGYDLVQSRATADSFVATTTGTLTIAGTSKPVEMTVVGGRTANGVATATGSVKIRMSEFGIKPPTFFFGTLRVGDEVTINFDLSADHAAAVSAGIVNP